MIRKEYIVKFDDGFSVKALDFRKRRSVAGFRFRLLTSLQRERCIYENATEKRCLLLYDIKL